MPIEARDFLPADETLKTRNFLKTISGDFEMAGAVEPEALFQTVDPKSKEFLDIAARWNLPCPILAILKVNNSRLLRKYQVCEVDGYEDDCCVESSPVRRHPPAPHTPRSGSYASSYLRGSP